MQKKQLANLLEKSGVLKFGDFTLKSGRKSNYFLNFGNISEGSTITELAEMYADIYMEKILKPTVLFGPAYKGISLVVAVASAIYDKYGLDLKYCYNRKEEKDHGEGGSIVGYQPAAGEEITIIEDVITAGTAVTESVSLLEAVGAKPKHLIVAVDRLENAPGSDKIASEYTEEKFGVEVHSIATIEDIKKELPDKFEEAGSMHS